MPVVTVTRPTLSKTTETVEKPAAYGVYTKPSTAPTYPVTLANVNGKGRYEVIVVGDGDASAVVNVYVDGATTPVDSVTCNTPAVIQGTFNSSVSIRIEGRGLPSTMSYIVGIDTTVIKDVTVQ